jgi:two-component system cell cycle sensor histidine kinase/response regulator CckA
MEPSRYEHQNSEERLRILIVDDDLSMRKILYRILENGGYDVLSASSGMEAVAILRRSSPSVNLLITDYNMPGMNGLELGRECSALNAALPVLYISGDHPDQELRADLDLRKRGFLAKPFRREELLRSCKEMLLKQPEPQWSARVSL